MLQYNNTDNQCHIHPDRITDSYCLNCKILVCNRCKSDHKSCKFEDYEDFYNQIVASSRDVIQNSEHSAYQIQSYKPQVVTKFENAKQVNEKLRQTITSLFKDIHDILHFKEFELKRDIGSLDSENDYKYGELETYYQNQVYQLENSVRALKIGGISTNDKINFIKAYLKTTNQPVESSPAIKNEHVTYLIGSVNETFISSIKDTVLSIQLSSNIPRAPLSSAPVSLSKTTPPINNNTSHYAVPVVNNNIPVQSINSTAQPTWPTTPPSYIEKPTKHNNNILNTCSNNSLKHYSLENFDRVLTKSSPIDSDVVFPNNVVYQNNTYGDNKFILINPAQNVLYNIQGTFIRPTPINGLPNDITTIFNGKDTIYIFGVTPDYPISTQIWKYGIFSGSFTAVRNRLPLALHFPSLTIHDDNIFIIGSCTNIIGTFATVIIKYNTTTDSIAERHDIPNKDDTKKNVGGCYFPKLSTFYLIEDKFLYKMKLENKLKIKVTTIPINSFPSSDYVKIIYDKKDFFYCMPYHHAGNNILGCYEFNPNNSSLTPFKFMFSSNEYISIEN